jgi:hypothetical protein
MNSEALVATLLHAFLQLTVLLAFPFVAVRNWRVGGWRHLAFAAVGAFAIIFAVALALVSEFFGNRLSSRYGYVHVAAQVVTIFMITLGLPVLVVTSVVPSIPRQLSMTVHYCVALAAGGAAWAAAVFLSVYLMPLLARTADQLHPAAVAARLRPGSRAALNCASYNCSGFGTRNCPRS